MRYSIVVSNRGTRNDNNPFGFNKNFEFDQILGIKDFLSKVTISPFGLIKELLLICPGGYPKYSIGEPSEMIQFNDQIINIKPVIDYLHNLNINPIVWNGVIATRYLDKPEYPVMFSDDWIKLQHKAVERLINAGVYHIGFDYFNHFFMHNHRKAFNFIKRYHEDVMFYLESVIRVNKCTPEQLKYRDKCYAIGTPYQTVASINLTDSNRPTFRSIETFIKDNNLFNFRLHLHSAGVKWYKTEIDYFMENFTDKIIIQEKLLDQVLQGYAVK